MFTTNRFPMNIHKHLVKILLVAEMVFLAAGCGGDKKPLTPEKQEKVRQNMIKNAERQRRES